jgi:hypothetical protein
VPAPVVPPVGPSSTVAAPLTAIVPTTVVLGAGAEDSSSSWLWLLALVAAAAAIIAVVLLLRSRAAAQARWIASGRDLARRAEFLADGLDDAAAVLAGSPDANRRVWLDASETLNALAGTSAALGPDAPKVPGDPEGTNTLAAALETLRTDLTVCRSATIEAERTRFELVGPTPEQLDYASRSVRQGCASVVASAHALTAALDRVDPLAAPVASQAPPQP